MAVTEVRPGQLAPRPSRGRWMEWLTTTDHKKIGIMYLVNSFVFFAIGGTLALLIRTQLARPENHVLSAQAYNEVFTIHGTLMIFLVIFPFLSGFGNYIVPLQIGALDMAFPRVNALSFWLLPVGGLTIVSGFFVPGGAAAVNRRGGLLTPWAWTARPALQARARPFPPLPRMFRPLGRPPLCLRHGALAGSRRSFPRHAATR